MRVLVTGASGRLGGWVMREARRRGHDATGWSGAGEGIRVDLTGPDVGARIAGADPDLVIHCAAMSAVDACYAQPAEADAVNHYVPGRLARLVAGAGRRLVAVSTDMVFDGEGAPYGESDPPAPLSVYGATKRRGEEAVLEHGLAVARVALLYGPSLTARRSHFDDMVEKLRARMPIRLFEDEWRTPLSMRAAAEALLEIGERGGSGVFHVGGERMSRWELGVRTAGALGLPATLVERGRQAEVIAPEPRPRDLSLRCDRLPGLIPGWRAPILEDELQAMMQAP